MTDWLKRVVRTSWVASLLVLGACSSGKEIPEEPVLVPDEKEETPVTPSDSLLAETEMNPFIDEYLSKFYLWNEEYKGMKRDLTIPYKDSYENFLKTTLMGMSTNTLDKKGNFLTGYTLYSYVDRTEKKVKSKSLLAAGVNHGIEKEDKVKSYGISKLLLLQIVDKQGSPTGNYAFAVQSVYPASSANSFDVKRGSIIFEMNGEVITLANYMSVYLELLSPTQSSVQLLVRNGKEEPKEVYLQTTEIDSTPILKHTVVEEGSHRIGYLMYDSFDAAYDDDLLEVISGFKSKGITDLVLDLRYNGGGYVISSMMLSSCVVGSSCKDKVFQYIRYNSERMKNVEETQKTTGYRYDTSAKYFYHHFVFDNYYGVNLSSYALDLNRVFVLTTEATGSASETLINSLRGIGIEVVLIGEPTNGKNVGMEMKEFTAGNYDYELAPITFQSYNAEKKTIPETGLPVNYTVKDWDNSAGCFDFGDKNESMFAKAIELITGKPVSQPQTRSATPLDMKPVSIELPVLKQNRPQGALMMNIKEEAF